MCHVASFKKYLGKLHASIDDLWTLEITEMQEVWYSRSAIGKNTLNGMMTATTCQSCIPTTSATAITALNDAGVEARRIMRASGHKSESSIRSYSCRLSEPRKQAISDCLSETLGSVSKLPQPSPQSSENELLGLSVEEIEAILSDSCFQELTQNDPVKSQPRVPLGGNRWFECF
jgi:hypothetical protein